MEQVNDPKEITIIDVRTPEEYSMGHVEGSINIPLNEIEHRVLEIKKMNCAILLCCASGIRSAQAYNILQKHGVTYIHNAGSWMQLQNNISKAKHSI